MELISNNIIELIEPEKLPQYGSIVFNVQNKTIMNIYIYDYKNKPVKIKV
jgi:hypothetical protein